jgi:hypothetical protein
VDCTEKAALKAEEHTDKIGRYIFSAQLDDWFFLFRINRQVFKVRTRKAQRLHQTKESGTVEDAFVHNLQETQVLCSWIFAVHREVSRC